MAGCIPFVSLAGYGLAFAETSVLFEVLSLFHAQTRWSRRSVP
jgi:hypothetical protein